MVVIDSNIAVYAVLPAIAPPQLDAGGRVTEWKEQAEELVVPALWVTECTSVIRRSVYARMITQEEGEVALNDLLSLGVRVLVADEHVAMAAFRWAGRLQQVRAYDSFYLALAEELGVEFWSADERLVNAARQIGADWVHWIGED